MLVQKDQLKMFFLPVIYVLAVYGIVRFILQQPETMSITFLNLTPFLAGLLTVLLDKKPYLSFLELYLNSLIIALIQFLAICFVLGVIFGVESFVCIVLALPIYLAAIFIGCAIGCLIRKYYVKKPPFLSIGILPFLILPIETNFLEARDDIRTVESVKIIAAPADVIWSEIISMQSIHETEVPWSFAHNIMQIPKPVSAKLDAEKVGGVRIVNWQNDVTFDEIITRWEPNRFMEYKWKFYSKSFPKGTVDDYLEIGGKYLDIQTGGYHLKPLGENTTEVSLFTTYRSTTRFNFYTAAWARFLIDDFHNAILTIAQARAT